MFRNKYINEGHKYTRLVELNNNYLHSTFHNVPLSSIRDSFWKVIIVTKIFSLVHVGVPLGVQLRDRHKRLIVRSQGLKLLIFLWVSRVNIFYQKCSLSMRQKL